MPDLPEAKQRARHPCDEEGASLPFGNRAAIRNLGALYSLPDRLGPRANPMGPGMRVLPSISMCTGSQPLKGWLETTSH